MVTSIKEFHPLAFPFLAKDKGQKRKTDARGSESIEIEERQRKHRRCWVDFCHVMLLHLFLQSIEDCDHGEESRAKGLLVLNWIGCEIALLFNI